MVYFALTRKGYDDLVAELGRAPHNLWVNHEVLSLDEIKQLHESGVYISNFTIFVDPLDPSDVAQAVETVTEHHPGDTVWVEQVLGR